MAEKQEMLTEKQRRALIALIGARNIQDAAKIARVGERSLYRWLATADFRSALLVAEGEAIDMATRRLIGLQDQAIDALTEVLNDKEVSQAVRVRASQIVLEYLMRMRDLRNLESRLVKIELLVRNKE